MRIAKLVAHNFRGIRSLSWQPGSQAMSCIIGPGDSAKTTVLDAIEATLSPRWITFSESDFHLGNILNPITIELTIAELSKALISDQRFGLYIRGLAVDGSVHDEPETDHEPALTRTVTYKSNSTNLAVLSVRRKVLHISYPASEKLTPINCIISLRQP